MKKYVILGALFGALIIPVGTLGLISRTAEFLGRPLTFIPAMIVNAVIDTSTMPGGVSMGLLVLISAIMYALIGALLYRIRTKFGAFSAVASAIILYVVLFVVNTGM